MSPLLPAKPDAPIVSQTPARRLYRVWPWLAAGSILPWLGVDAKLSWGQPYDSSMLAFLSALAFGLTVLCAWPIFKLKRSETPIWLTWSAIVVIIVAMTSVSLLHDQGVIFWPRIYILLPVAILISGLALAALLVEATRNVRVYMDSRGYVYLPKP